MCAAEEWDALHISQSSDALVPCGAKLDDILARALALANARQHPYATLDHLLMALIDDQDAATVLEASAVEVDRLRARLTDVLDGLVASPAVEAAPDAKPTVGVQRTIARVALDARDSGRAKRPAPTCWRRSSQRGTTRSGRLSR